MSLLGKPFLLCIAFMSFACNANSSGTAFSIASGYLLTNQHVISDCSSIDVITENGRRPATVLDSVKEIDLALLRVYGLRGAVAKFRKSGQVRLGEPIHVFGFPLTGALSSKGNFTTGTVSSLRGFKDSAGEIQITAPVQPGNSGGPVLDASGYVVGVVSSKLDALLLAKTTGDLAQNVNFAISLDVVEDFLEKNKISVQEVVKSEPLTSDKVAEIAQGFTYQIQCNLPDKKVTKPRTLDSDNRKCPEPYDEKTWNNCIGQYSFQDGSTYLGSYQRGKRNGIGTYRFKDGTTYRGTFLDGKFDGKGVITYYDGGQYEGEFKNDRSNGIGTYRFKDGTTYRGTFLDEKFDGKGIITYSNGQTYEGEFKNDQRHGEGKLTYPNGDLFTGMFVNNERHGRGTYLFKSGMKYVGDYKNSQRDGYGVLTDPSGNVVYAGQWVAGKAQDGNLSGDASGTVLVRRVQIELNRLGFSSGAIDGILGPQTQSAIVKAQRAFNFKQDGVPSQALLDAMRKQSTQRSGTGPINTPLGYLGIFVNLETMATGVSLRRDNLKDAEIDANNKCVQNSGGRKCVKLLSGVGSRCVAIAIGEGGIGGASQATAELTRSVSIKHCGKYATPSSCAVKYEYCFTN